MLPVFCPLVTQNKKSEGQSHVFVGSTEEKESSTFGTNHFAAAECEAELVRDTGRGRSKVKRLATT